jgi:hypothetical protein
MNIESSTLANLLPDVSKEWFYIIFAVIIGTASAVNWALRSGEQFFDKENKDSSAVQAKHLWRRYEIFLKH